MPTYYQVEGVRQQRVGLYRAVLHLVQGVPNTWTVDIYRRDELVIQLPGPGGLPYAEQHAALQAASAYIRDFGH